MGLSASAASRNLESARAGGMQPMTRVEWSDGRVAVWRCCTLVFFRLVFSIRLEEMFRASHTSVNTDSLTSKAFRVTCSVGNVKFKWRLSTKPNGLCVSPGETFILMYDRSNKFLLRPLPFRFPPAPFFASLPFLPSLLCQTFLLFFLSLSFFPSVPPFLCFFMRPSSDLLFLGIFFSWFPSFYFRLLPCSPPLCQFFFFLSFLPSLTLFAFFCLSRACSPQTSNDMSPERHQALTLLSGSGISNRIHSDMNQIHEF